MKNRIIYLSIWILALWLMIMYDGISCEMIFSAVTLMPIVAVIINFIIVKETFAKWNITGEKLKRGKTAKITALIDNTSIFPIGRIEIKYVIRDMAGNESEMIFSTNLMALSEKKCIINIIPQHSGALKLTMEYIKIYDFLGLTYRKRNISSYVNLAVLPDKALRIRDIGNNVEVKTEEGDVYSESYPGNDRSQIFDVAVYKEGDSIRDIHWKLSSKTDELMVKRFSQPVCSDTNIFLDFDSSLENTGRGIDNYFTYLYGLLKDLSSGRDRVRLYVYDKNRDIYVEKKFEDAIIADYSEAPSEEYVVRQINSPNNKGRNIVFSNRIRDDEQIIFVDTSVKDDNPSVLKKNLNLSTREKNINIPSYIFRALLVLVGVFSCTEAFLDTLFVEAYWSILSLFLTILVITLSFAVISLTRNKKTKKILQILLLCIIVLLEQPTNIIYGAGELINALGKDMMIYYNEDNRLIYGLLELESQCLYSFVIFLSAILSFLLMEFTWNIPSGIIHIVFTLPFFGAAYVYGCSPRATVTAVYVCYFFMILVYVTNYSFFAKKEKKIIKKAYYESTVNIGALWGYIAAVSVVIILGANALKGYSRSDILSDVKAKINSAFSGVNEKMYLTRAETAQGGMNKGELGEVDKIEYSDDEQLEVTVDGNIVFPIYLRGYVGTYYTGVSWEQNNKESREYIDKRLSYMDTDIQYIFNETFLGLENGNNTQGKENRHGYISVTNKMDDDIAYIPYGAYYNGSLKADGEADEREDEKILYEVYQPADSIVIEQEDIDKSIISDIYNKAAVYIYTNAQYSGEYIYKVQEIIPDKYIYNNVSYNIKYGNPDKNGYEVYIDIVKSYLREGYEYTLSPGKLEVGQDFAEKFMEERKGYCVYFATLATLMFREMGIPARYVEGYYVSPDGSSSEENSADGKTIISVTDKNAHAWTEIYIKDYGWYPVEVTQGYTGVNYDLSDSTEKNESNSTKDDEPQTTNGEENTTEENNISKDFEIHSEPVTRDKDKQHSEETEKIKDDTDEEKGGFPVRYALVILLIVSAVGIVIYRQNLKTIKVEKKLGKAPGKALPDMLNELRRALDICGYDKNINVDNEQFAKELSGYLYNKLPEEYKNKADAILDYQRISIMMETFDKAMYSDDKEYDDEEKMSAIDEATELIMLLYYSNNMFKRLYLKYIKCLYLKQK